MEALEEIARFLPRQRHRIEDDDAVQEGFLRMARRGTQGLENPGGYWYTAARRAQIERLRKAQAERRTVSRWLVLQTPEQPCDDVDDSLLQQLSELVEGELRGKRRALAKLELEGITRVSDLSRLLGISQGAVKVLRHRTYRQLRQSLTEQNGLAGSEPRSSQHEEQERHAQQQNGTESNQYRVGPAR